MTARLLSFLNSRRRGRKDGARRGVTAVETALIAPIFFMMLIGIVEMSMMILTQHMLENATFRATRLAKTGYVETGKTQQDTVTGVLNGELESLGSLIDISKVSVTTTAYNSFSNIGVAGQGTTGMGESGEIVVYTVTYPWKIFTPLIGDLFGNSGVVNLTSQIVVRNEPY